MMPIFERAAWRGNPNAPGYFPKMTPYLKEVVRKEMEKNKQIKHLAAEVERLREIVANVEGNWHFKDCENSSWPIHECGCMKKYAQAALEEKE